MKEHDIPEVAVAPRPGEISLFVNSGPLAQENLDRLMAITAGQLPGPDGLAVYSGPARLADSGGTG